jgi:hypothetical protein
LNRSKAKKLGLRFLLYVAIALGVLVFCALLVAVAIYTGHTSDLPVGWFGLAGFTPLLFWTVIKMMRKDWERPAFWLALLALLILHLLGFVGLLLRYPHWRLLWFIPTSMIEAGVFVVILGKLFGGEREGEKGSR